MRELGIGFVPYSPLGRGFLTGTITSSSDLVEGDARARRYPRFTAENLEKNRAVVDRVRAIAERSLMRTAATIIAAMRFRSERLRSRTWPICTLLGIEATCLGEI